jgi:hypothetical protein
LTDDIEGGLIVLQGAWMIFLKLNLAIMSVFIMSAAGAKETAKSLSAEAAPPSMEEQPLELAAPQLNDTDDVDVVITNNKLRADSGSKSRYSISNGVNYQGGMMSKPLSEIRPNITGGTGATAFASLTDSLAAKFSLPHRRAILTGAGLRWITPFYGLPKPVSRTGVKFSGQKVDLDNPYLTYQYIYRWQGVQSVFSTGATLFTRSDQRAQGFVGMYDIRQTSVVEIGHTAFSVGGLLDINTSMFDKGGAFKTGQADYSGGFYPFLEYQFNKRFNFRTIVGLWSFEHLRSTPSATTFFKDKIYESMGIGISVARDVFLYPNVQFLPENIRSDLTNVGLSASINLF